MKISIEIEVDEETLKAGEFIYSHKFDEPMSPGDFRRFVMQHALEARFHAIRSRRKWAKEKIYESPNFQTEPSYTCRTVTDKNGKEHQVMLPNGRERSVGLGVTQPREGSWKCEGGSPTGRCWYDNQKDPAWDYCLFCGEPHERK